MPVRTTLQTGTARQPAVPHSVPDNLNEHNGISNSTTAAPTQAVASSSQNSLEDGLKVTISIRIIYLLIVH